MAGALPPSSMTEGLQCRMVSVQTKTREFISNITYLRYCPQRLASCLPRLIEPVKLTNCIHHISEKQSPLKEVAFDRHSRTRMSSWAISCLTRWPTSSSEKLNI